jgi:membrane protein YdbS with pleckstrin-like domain
VSAGPYILVLQRVAQFLEDKNVSFTKNQLLPGEELIILSHQHFLVLARAVIINLAALAVLIALSLVSNRMWILYFDVVPLCVLLWEILVRRQREYIVTNRRVVKQEGVFSINSFDAPLDKINNVFHEQTLIGRLFKYGNVGLETASEQGTTMFSHVPDPVGFKNCIVHQRELYSSSPGSREGAATREDIPRLIEDLASLRERNIITAEEFDAKKRALLDKIR